MTEANDDWMFDRMLVRWSIQRIGNWEGPHEDAFDKSFAGRFPKGLDEIKENMISNGYVLREDSKLHLTKKGWEYYLKINQDEYEYHKQLGENYLKTFE